MSNSAGYLRFTTIPKVAVAPDHRLYLLDPESLEIVAFDGAGREQARFAGRGLGLGKISGPGDVAVVGGRIVVSSYESGLMRVWTTEGTFFDEILPDELAPTIGLVTYDDASVIRTYRVPGTSDRLAIAHLWLDGREEILFTIALPKFPTGSIMSRPILLEELAQFPRLAGGNGGMVYLNAGLGYSVAAFDAEDSERWVVRLPWEAVPYTAERAKAFLARIRGVEERFRPQFSPPSHFPVLAGIRADGHGRLYVFPFVKADAHAFPDEFPVDVYTAEGDLLLNGVLRIGGRSWLAAVDNVVFGTRIEPDTGMYQVFSATIVVPDA